MYFFGFGYLRKSKTLCFLGDGAVSEKVKSDIFRTVDRAVSDGYENFIFDASSRFCLECARQVVLRQRKQRGDIPDRIRLFAAVPYEEHINSENEKFRDTYYDILANCDGEKIFAACREEFVEADFAEYIIDKSGMVVCSAENSDYVRLYASAVRSEIKVF